MDILASKSELKQIIQDAIDNQLIPLKEELENLNLSINRDFKLNYLNSIAKLLEKEALETTQSFSCSYHVATDKTCKNILGDYIGQYTEALSIGDIASAFSLLSDFEKIALANSKDVDKSANCKQHWDVVSRIIKRHREVAKDISALFSAHQVPSDIGELDFSPDELYEEVLLPFSHPLRIKIVHILKRGSKRFTALMNELNVKNTGLLVHHLKPLTGGNLVIQDHRKQYSLSDKGFLVAKYFAQLSASLNPEAPITVTMQPLVVLSDN